MGNYVGYFYPIDLTLKDNSTSPFEIENCYGALENKCKYSQTNYNVYTTRKKAVSCVSSTSTSTDDSLSRFDDIDIDKSTTSKSVLFSDINMNNYLFPQNIFYYDWDDTLFFTTALKFRFIEYCGCLYTEENENNNLLLMHFHKEISNLDKLASSILSKSLLLGNVYIVTNSNLKWVLSMARTYYPKTYHYIISRNITVISARDNYSQQYSNDKHIWKQKSFIDIANTFNYNQDANIISLGDNQCDIDAAKAVSKCFSKSIVKTVKFRERPSFEELAFQLDEYLFRFDEIVECCQNYNYIL